MHFENISLDDGMVLVRTARKVVAEYLTNHKKKYDTTFNEKFSFKAGVFVTINDRSGLRGCIGYPLAVKKLSDALIDAAISASTNDPRFSPVKLNDLDNLMFELTILSDTEEISTNLPNEILDSIKINCQAGLAMHIQKLNGLSILILMVLYGMNKKFILQNMIRLIHLTH